MEKEKTLCPHFKVILLGETGVGKTSLFLRIRDKMFSAHPAFLADGYEVTRTVNNNEQISLCIWDTSGNEKTITRNYYRHAHAVVLIYDVNNPASLLYLSKWASESLDYAPNATRVLLGNKSDLEKTVSTESVDNFQYTFSCTFVCSVSAKTGHGVEDFAKILSETLLDSVKTPLFQESPDEDKIELHRSPMKTKSSCC